jgi:hypothetical protein
MRSARAMGRGASEGGFVLALVVFMLFAIAVASATGYLVVSSEFMLGRHSRDGAEALTVARAGLERFVSETMGVLPDTTTYALGNGVAVVTTRRVYEEDGQTHIYYVRSEGTVDDIFTPGTPARRVVGAYATHHWRPVEHHAAVMIGADALSVEGGGQAHGIDYSTALDCAEGGGPRIVGAIARLSVTGQSPSDIQGSPPTRTWAGGWSAISDSIGVRWDVISDPNFPVDFENTLPSFGALPADSFPVIRYTGWVNASFSGRGVLLVDGVFDPNSSFSWDGIVLARHIDDAAQGQIDGMLVAGLEEPNMYSSVGLSIDVKYHACNVYAASESLSYLELMPHTVHEVN